LTGLWCRRGASGGCGGLGSSVGARPQRMQPRSRAIRARHWWWLAVRLPRARARGTNTPSRRVPRITDTIAVQVSRSSIRAPSADSSSSSTAPSDGQVFQFDQYGDLGDPSGCLFACPAVVRSVRASARRCFAVRWSSREVRPIRVFNASRSAAPATGSRYPSRRNIPFGVSDNDSDLFWCRSSAVWSRASGRH
jgi:hypothetical protein